MEKLSGYFMEPQNFSVNDGDGIRTIIFFAGCPLKCKWCANPESSVGFNKALYDKKINTKINEKHTIRKYNSDELIEIIEKQRLFYRFSGGGVTFSGGEPTLQQDMLRELSYKLYDKGINLAIETSAFFDFDQVQDILEKLDLIFVDLKHIDDDKHLLYTGVSNKKILENISRLDELNIPVVVRIPLIGTVNADEENVKNTAKFLVENFKNPKLEMLPYHSLGDAKYESLGLEKPSSEYYTPKADYIKKLEDIVMKMGLEVVSY